jgi:hypothetical protein
MSRQLAGDAHTACQLALDQCLQVANHYADTEDMMLEALYQEYMMHNEDEQQLDRLLATVAAQEDELKHVRATSAKYATQVVQLHAKIAAQMIELTSLRGRARASEAGVQTNDGELQVRCLLGVAQKIEPTSLQARVCTADRGVQKSDGKPQVRRWLRASFQVTASAPEAGAQKSDGKLQVRRWQGSEREHS